MTKADRSQIFLLLFLMIMMYYPVLGTYALTDSYEFFRNAGNPGFVHVFIQGGRPIFGLALTELFQWTDSIDDLKYIRMIAMVGNALLIISFHRFMLTLGYRRQFVFAFSIFFISSAFIGLVTGWTALFQAGWAAWVAFLSARFFLKGISTRGTFGSLWIALALVAGVISLMLYQPSYTFFVFVVFVGYEKDRLIRRLLWAVAVYFTTYLVYAGLFNAILWYTSLPPLDRAGLLAFEPFEKIRWFLENALVHSFKFNLLLVRNTFANMLRVPVAILFLVCIAAYFRRGITREKLIYAAVVVVSYFLAYIPNLVAAENHASNRSLVTVVLLNAFFLYKALDIVIRTEKWQRAAYVVVTVIFVVFGFTNLRYGITRIQTTEYAILKEATRDLLAADKSHEIDTLHIIRPTRDFLEEQGIIQRESGGEYGLLSNSVDWVALPMFQTFVDEISHETGHEPANITLRICAAEERAECDGKKFLIDIGKEFIENYRDYY